MRSRAFRVGAAAFYVELGIGGMGGGGYAGRAAEVVPAEAIS